MGPNRPSVVPGNVARRALGRRSAVIVLAVIAVLAGACSSTSPTREIDHDSSRDTIAGPPPTAPPVTEYAGPGLSTEAVALLQQLRDFQQETDLCSILSSKTVKTVLAGRSRGVFQGKIHVHQVAQRTDGYQMNQALLLSDEAEIDSKPQLEIYADDVKCSHGATVGALDADSLFYLRARGIPADEAKAMLVEAFLHEAVETVTDETLRGALTRALDAWWSRQAVAAA